MFAIPDSTTPSYMEGVEYKGFKIILSTDYHLFEIRALDNEALAPALLGRFTAVGLVKNTIDEFLDKNKNKHDQHTSTARD